LKEGRKMDELDILYMFGFSSNEGTQMKKLLPLISAQVKKNKKIGIALLNDGVIGYNKKGMIPIVNRELLNLEVSMHALVPDLNARGIPIENIHEKVKLIGYNELVDVLESSKKIISWM